MLITENTLRRKALYLKSIVIMNVIDFIYNYSLDDFRIFDIVGGMWLV